MKNVPIKEEQDGLAEYLVWALQKALRETRQENGGVPLDVVAWIIKDEFSKEEVEALIKQLTNLDETIE